MNNATNYFFISKPGNILLKKNLLKGGFTEDRFFTSPGFDGEFVDLSETELRAEFRLDNENQKKYSLLYKDILIAESFLRPKPKMIVYEKFFWFQNNLILNAAPQPMEIFVEPHPRLSFDINDEKIKFPRVLATMVQTLLPSHSFDFKTSIPDTLIAKTIQNGREYFIHLTPKANPAQTPTQQEWPTKTVYVVQYPSDTFWQESVKNKIKDDLKIVVEHFEKAIQPRATGKPLRVQTPKNDTQADVDSWFKPGCLIGKRF